MYDCLACMSVYDMHAVSKEAREGVRSLGTGVTGSCDSPLFVCWALNLGPLDEQPALLTAAPSPQSCVFLSGPITWKFLLIL